MPADEMMNMAELRGGLFFLPTPEGIRFLMSLKVMFEAL